MLKDKLVQSAILAHPFILDVDASNECIGAVLSHRKQKMVNVS